MWHLVVVAVVSRGAESALERWLATLPQESASLHVWAADEGDPDKTIAWLNDVSRRFTGWKRWTTHGAEDDHGRWLAEQANLVPAELLVVSVRRGAEGELDIPEREMELLACAVGPVLVLVDDAPVAHHWRIGRGRRVHALRRHAIVADALGLREKEPSRPPLRLFKRAGEWQREVRASDGPFLLITGRQPVF